MVLWKLYVEYLTLKICCNEIYILEIKEIGLDLPDSG
jgi:hypothetical protein